MAAAKKRVSINVSALQVDWANYDAIIKAFSDSDSDSDSDSGIDHALALEMIVVVAVVMVAYSRLVRRTARCTVLAVLVILLRR